MKRPKSIIIKTGKTVMSGDTMIITLTNYRGDYIGLFHIRGKEIQAQFRAENIKLIALIKDKDFITGNNLVPVKPIKEMIG